MLHRVNKPACLADMKKLLRYQRSFLRLCLFAPRYPLDEVACKEWFGNEEIGRWNWQRIVWQGDVTAFGESVFLLMSHAFAHRSDTKSVFKKVCHDQQFFVKRQNPEFVFQYLSIDEDWRAKLRPFLENFYGLFDKPGYPAATFGFDNDLSRKAFIDAQYAVNPPVCPYCDAAPGDRSEKLDSNEAEHWLPKSIYPHLSIHWANLFRACKPCNQTYKKNKNPIGSCGTRELERTYHPYDKFAVDTMKVVAQLKSTNPRLYQLETEDPENPICVTEIERVLALSERWSGRMNDLLERDKSALVADRVQEIIDEGEELTEELVGRKLNRMANSRRTKIGKRVNALLETAVLDFQVSNEVDEIFFSLQRAHGFQRG